MKENNQNIIENDEVDEEKDAPEEFTEIDKPFNPTDIDIQAMQTTLDTIIKRIRYEEIDLQPDFQRAEGLWKEEFMSRLIESLLIRFPLPAFYFDATDDNKWQVVDGLQRLSTIDRFVLKKNLKLRKLEFLKDFENFTYDDLPRNMQRRIEEAQITMYLIKPGTPAHVKFSLFYRINTGGLQLKPQEIRHAISQGINNGQATNFLADITKDTLFQKVVHVSGKRMLDKELILRYVALKQKPYKEYKAPMISFLNNAMEELGKTDETHLKYLKAGILQALDLAYKIFGEDAFRKSLVDVKQKKVLNRALFEAVSVLFSNLNASEIENLRKKETTFLADFKNLFNDYDFKNAITTSTADSSNLIYRFEKISEVINRNIK